MATNIVNSLWIGAEAEKEAMRGGLLARLDALTGAACLPKNWMAMETTDGTRLVRADRQTIRASVDPALWPEQISQFEFAEGEQWTDKQIASMVGAVPVELVSEGERLAVRERDEALKALATTVDSMKVQQEIVVSQQRQIAACLPWEGATIRFVECDKGHGKLTANNWLPTECPHCRIAALEAELLHARMARDEWSDRDQLAQEVRLLRLALAAKDARIAQLKTRLASTPVAFEDPDAKPSPPPGFLRAIRTGNKAAAGLIGPNDKP